MPNKRSNRKGRISVTFRNPFSIAIQNHETYNFHGQETELQAAFGTIAHRVRLNWVKFSFFPSIKATVYEGVASKITRVDVVLLYDKFGNQGDPGTSTWNDWLEVDWPDPGEFVILNLNNLNRSVMSKTYKVNKVYDLYEAETEDVTRVHVLARSHDVADFPATVTGYWEANYTLLE